MEYQELKIRSIYFRRLLDGSKKCEIRLNDRDYQVNDIINFTILEDDDNQKSYRAEEGFKITHVLTFPEGLKEGYVALSLKRISLTPTNHEKDYRKTWRTNHLFNDCNCDQLKDPNARALSDFLTQILL